MGPVPLPFAILELASFPLMILIIFKFVVPKINEAKKKRLTEAGLLLFGNDEFVIQDNQHKFIGFTVPGDPSLQFTKNDKTLHLRHSNGGKNSPPTTHLFLQSDHSISLQVTRETVFHNFAKSLNLGSEIQLGDKELDDHFFLRTSNESTARSLTANSDFRSFLRLLMSDKYFSQLLFISREDCEKRAVDSFTPINIKQSGILLRRTTNLQTSSEKLSDLKEEIDGMFSVASRL